LDCRHGGSDEAFQLIAAANTVLSDERLRAAYDAGEGVERGVREDGSEGPSLRERVERTYFPERYELLLFGEPELKREWEQERRVADALPEHHEF
jgi:curved DNA-binding protein CbpA